MKTSHLNVFELHRIAQRAKQRVDENESLDERLTIIKEELINEGYDFDIFDFMSGLSESYSVFYESSDFWIQLFPGKGSENYAVCVRVLPIAVLPIASHQEIRLAAQKLHDISSAAFDNLRLSGAADEQSPFLDITSDAPLPL